MMLSTFKIIVISIVLTVFGIYLIPKISVKLNPSSTLPSLTIQYSWINASSYAIERDVTGKLESAFATLRGLENLNSKSSRENGAITLEFDQYTDLDKARFETSAIIRQVYKQLPERCSYPIISVNKPNDIESKAFLSYSISSDNTSFEIREVINAQIEPLIGSIKYIDKVEVYGANRKEYVLKYNKNELAELDLSVKDLLVAIKKNHKNEALGNIFFYDQFISISLKPQKEEINWHIPIKKINNTLIYLDQLVTIREQEQESSSYYRINGKNAVILALFATREANTIDLKEQVDKKMKDILSRLPSNYKIVTSYDSTEYIKEELRKIFERTLYTIIILLLFIFLASRSFNYLLVIILSLTVNLGVAFLLYFVFNVEIQLYSLAGITISLGLIVDNSIVVIDHLRHQKNNSVIIPILASTLTTIGSLSIIYFLDKEYRANLIDFASVIVINLLVSLLVSLFLIPALLRKITVPLNKESKWNLKVKTIFYFYYAFIINWLLKWKKINIVVIIIVFGIPFFMLPNKLEENNTWYEKTYNKTFGNEWYNENLRPYLDRYLGGTFRLFSNYVFENSSYNRNEETKLYVLASMEKGATVHQMNEVFLEVENYLQSFPQINQYTTSISGGDKGRMEITFKNEFINSSVIFLIKSRLINRVLDIGGVNWNIFGVGNGFVSGDGRTEPVNFSVKAKGYNYDHLNDWADSLKLELEKNARVKNVVIKENNRFSQKPSYDYYFTVDNEKLAISNSSPLKILEELKRLALSKYTDLSLNIGGKYAPIRVESKESNDFDIWQIKNTPLNDQNNLISLKNNVTISKKIEEDNIYKENQEYIRLVDFQYNGASKFGSIFLDEKLSELKLKLPIGYSFENIDRRFWFGNDESNNYGLLMILVVIIIFFVCSILFESLTQPFIVLSVIPVSFIGVFLTFYLFDFNFDQGGLASFVLLSGITVNSSIFIVNTFNKLKRQNPKQSSLTIYLEAYKQKIFPIVITIFSTIIGFIPFVKDGQNEIFWFSLGAGTIGGLIFSLIGILIYLPVFALKKF